MGSKENIHYLFGQIGQRRGLEAERRFGRALQESLKSGNLPDWFRGCQISTNHENRRGIDFWILTDIGKIPIQIKSSMRGMEKARRRHPRIPAIIVPVYEQNESIASKCLQTIKPEREKYLSLRSPL